MPVIGGNRRVVVPAYSFDSESLQQRGRLIRPARVIDQVAEVVGGTDAILYVDVVEHGSKRGQVGVMSDISAIRNGSSRWKYGHATWPAAGRRASSRRR